MGYGIRVGLVEENKALLTMIQITVVGKKKAFPLDPPPGQTVYQMQWLLRRTLKATDVLENECEGRFVGISNLVSLRIVGKQLVIFPKALAYQGGYAQLATGKIQVDEDGALQILANSKSEMTLVTFTPSNVFDEDHFIRRAALLGWTIHPTTRQDLSGGELMYGADRDELVSDPLAAYERG